MCAVFALVDGKLEEMVEREYLKESDLQRYLADCPELLSAEAPERERRRWLLVKREMGVADREGAPDRWGLDHLFVDQDAIPTFVEVKRSSDTRLRREVVGQMLDYAANASAYWDAGRLRASFESRFEDADAAETELSEFVEGEYEPEEFWDAVAANLDERHLRLIFVADRIPRELRSIVEFLNEQLKETEVIAVEVKQYVEAGGDGRVSIVPQIIGETEMARRVKRAAGGTRTHRARATEAQFYGEIRAAYEPELAERMLALFEYARAKATRWKFGSGKSASAIVWLGESDDPEVANPIALRFSTGHVSVMTKHLIKSRGPEEMTRLIELLRRLPGTSDVLDDAVSKGYKTYCHFETGRVLASDEDLEAFKRVLDEGSVRAG